jgi:UDP-glucose 4-epimerase
MRVDPTQERVLVTGATGFVGRALSSRLSGEGRVRALSRKPASGPWHEHVAADITDAATLAGVFDGIDCVYHLAGLAHDVHGRVDPLQYELVNVDGTRNVVEESRRAGVERIVFLSSVKAMAEGGEVLESAAPAPVSVYGRTKLSAESVALDSAVAHATVIRAPLVYGPGVKGNIARMVHAVRHHRFPPPPRVANRRSMIHVDDLASVLVLAARSTAANRRRYVAGDGRAYATHEIYEWIVRALGRSVPSWRVPVQILTLLARAGDVAGRVTGRAVPFDSAAFEKLMGTAWFECSRIVAELGFRPSYTLESAMPDIVVSLLGRPQNALSREAE